MSGRWNPRAVKPCGTTAAYRRHYRRGEQPCPSCRQAEALRHAEQAGREAYNARRREHYRQARAAGMSSREAARYANARRGTPLETGGAS